MGWLFFCCCCFLDSQLLETLQYCNTERVTSQSPFFQLCAFFRLFIPYVQRKKLSRCPLLLIYLFVCFFLCLLVCLFICFTRSMKGLRLMKITQGKKLQLPSTPEVKRKWNVTINWFPLCSTFLSCLRPSARWRFKFLRRERLVRFLSDYPSKWGFIYCNNGFRWWKLCLITTICLKIVVLLILHNRIGLDAIHWGADVKHGRGWCL